MDCVELPLPEYDFAATLNGGQAFRWREKADGWEGVVHGHWVRLEPGAGTLRVRTAGTSTHRDWDWLRHYLALDEDLAAIRNSFPADAPLAAAMAAARGLRLLRQDPWECLASFILSSTKQIVQIQECVRLLAERFGQEIPAGREGCGRAWAFPQIAVLAQASESELRACKLGFRAKYLGGTARLLADGDVSLAQIASMPTAVARTELEKFPGVGRKIADCVLLFAYRRQDAFPVDVWVQQALRHLYFPRARRLSAQRLRHFSETYFGVNAGYAQQYLFHYVRTVLGRRWRTEQQRPASKTASVQAGLRPESALRCAGHSVRGTDASDELSEYGLRALRGYVDAEEAATPSHVRAVRRAGPLPARPNAWTEE